MNIDRMDRQIKVLNEFLIADCEEAIVETERELDEVIAGGDEWRRRQVEQHLVELRATLKRCEAELRAA